MNEYIITYKRDDMPVNYIGKTSKWANTDNDAALLLLKKKPDKNGLCVFKRGGSVRILQIKKL